MSESLSPDRLMAAAGREDQVCVLRNFSTALSNGVSCPFTAAPLPIPSGPSKPTGPRNHLRLCGPQHGPALAVGHLCPLHQAPGCWLQLRGTDRRAGLSAGWGGRKNPSWPWTR